MGIVNGDGYQSAETKTDINSCSPREHLQPDLQDAAG